jgi:HK97 family phage portal protein
VSRKKRPNTSKALAIRQRATEGEPRPGPYLVTNPTGVLPNEWGQYWNYWQMGFDPIAIGTNVVVEACVDAYAQTIAMCPGDHWLRQADGGRTRVTTSALSRILRRPNEYQSRSDFLLGLGRDLYMEGNTYALAIRNARFEVESLHPFNPKVSMPLVGPGGEIFYQLNGNNVAEKMMAGSAMRTTHGLVVPARDVLHVKLEPRVGEPLIGVPPIKHASASIAAQNMIGAQLVSFFGNMSRPSGVLSTDANLTVEQVTDMRARWNEQAKGLNAGGTPILTNGLKFQPMSVPAKDAEMSALMKLTQEEIFMAYGVPPAILGFTDKSSFASTEALMQFWLARSLGFAIDHVEVAFDHFFGLKGWPEEYVEMDTSVLLRQQFKDRIEGLARGVQTAIFTPNEARRFEDLPDKPGGDDPRVQQQQVPLDWGGFEFQPPAPAAPAATPAKPDDEEEPKPKPEDDAKDMKNLLLTFDTGDREYDRQTA